MWSQLFIIACALNLSLATIPRLHRMPRLTRKLFSRLHLWPIGDMEWEGGDRFRITEEDLNCLRDFNFIQENVIATKIANYKGTVVILTPKYKEGLYSSLFAFNKKLGSSYDPIFMPFPNAIQNKEQDCKAIQNAVDFYLDDNDLLWVLDSGIVETLECPKTICKPKVVVISMKEKKIIDRFSLSNFVTSKSHLDNIVVDYNECETPFLYISDSGSNQLFIYDVDNRNCTRMMLPSDVETCTVDETLYLMLLKRPKNSSLLYLSHESSSSIYSIDTGYLKNETEKAFAYKVAEKTAKMNFLGTDEKQNIYFSYMDEREVYCWNTDETNDLESLKPIYTSDKGLLPMSVMVEDGGNGLKLMEAAVDDYLTERCGVGAVHRVREIGRV